MGTCRPCLPARIDAMAMGHASAKGADEDQVQVIAFDELFQSSGPAKYACGGVLVNGSTSSKMAWVLRGNRSHTATSSAVRSPAWHATWRPRLATVAAANQANANRWNGFVLSPPFCGSGVLGEQAEAVSGGRNSCWQGQGGPNCTRCAGKKNVSCLNIGKES